MLLEIKFKKSSKIAQQATSTTSGSAGSNLCSCKKRKLSRFFLVQHFELIYKWQFQKDILEKLSRDLVWLKSFN